MIKGPLLVEQIEPPVQRLPVQGQGFLIPPVFSDDRKAIAFYSLALAFCPLDAEAYLRRGFAYNRLKNYDDALKDLERLQALNPDLDSCNGLFAYLGNNVAWHYVANPTDQDRVSRVLPLAEKAVAIEPGASLNGIFPSAGPG